MVYYSFLPQDGEGEDEKPMDDFNEDGDEQLEGEHDDDEYQEMAAEMCVLQEDDTALPEPAEVDMVVRVTDFACDFKLFDQ